MTDVDFNVWPGGLTRRDLIAYLTAIEGEPTVSISLSFVPNSARNQEAFRRLGTCAASCGCTGFSPKPDCPDATCFCTTDWATA